MANITRRKPSNLIIPKDNDGLTIICPYDQAQMIAREHGGRLADLRDIIRALRKNPEIREHAEKHGIWIGDFDAIKCNGTLLRVSYIRGTVKRSPTLYFVGLSSSSIPAHVVDFLIPAEKRASVFYPNRKIYGKEPLALSLRGVDDGLVSLGVLVSGVNIKNSYGAVPVVRPDRKAVGSADHQQIEPIQAHGTLPEIAFLAYDVYSKLLDKRRYQEAADHAMETNLGQELVDNARALAALEASRKVLRE